MEDTSKKTQDSIERAAESVGNAIVEVIDRLAGKQSDIVLSFQDLTLDAGVFKIGMTGAIRLDVVMAKEIEGSSSRATESATNYSSS